MVSALLVAMNGCASRAHIRSESLRADADRMAAQASFSKNLVKTNTFLLTTYQKIAQAGAPITIYIEGDGRSFITPRRVSPDPTPRNPLALKLAALDRSLNIAYLARPCQYTPHHLDRHCNALVWTDWRFSESTIRALNEAIEVLKSRAHSKGIHLVGFSGGGGVAVLVAARRHDVLTLRTIAGDLNHVRLTAYHQTTPLSGSLNPMFYVSKVLNIPQLHFSGENDTVVPPFIAADFVRNIRKAGSHCANDRVIKDATHHRGWEAFWKFHNEKKLEDHFPQECISALAGEFR